MIGAHHNHTKDLRLCSNRREQNTRGIGKAQMKNNIATAAATFGSSGVVFGSVSAPCL